MADVTKEIALKVTANDATGPALQSLEDKLNAAKKRMIELAAAGKQNTEEFIRLQQEAGEFKRTIEGVEQSVDSVAKSGTQGMQLFGEAVTAVTAGFTIATSVTALYGEENEELQKTVMKVQAAMAILQSVQALVAVTTKTSAVATTANRIALSLYNATVKGTTVSLKGFKAALAATGIGLIAVAAGLAYTNWEKLREILGLPPNNTKAIAQLEREIALMEAQGHMVETIDEKRKQLINLQAEEMKGQEKANKLNEIAILNAQAQRREDENGLTVKSDMVEIEQEDLELLKQKAGYFGKLVPIQGSVEEGYVKMGVALNEYTIKSIEQAAIVYKAIQEERREKEKLAQTNQELTQIEVDEAKRVAQLLNQIESEGIADRIESNKEWSNFWQKERNTKLAGLEQEEFDQKSSLENRRANTLAMAKIALGDTEAYNEKEKEINQRYNDLQAAQDEMYAEKRRLLKLEERDTNIKLAGEAFTGILSLGEAMMGTSEEDARKAFNLNKAASIADATVNTFLAATQALRDPSLPTVGKAFAVAGIIASGLAQVRKIAATKFKADGSSSATAGAGATGTGSTTPQPPQIFANPQTTNLGTGELSAGQGQGSSPMRAYVVERDISQTGRRVRRLEEFATLS